MRSRPPDCGASQKAWTPIEEWLSSLSADQVDALAPAAPDIARQIFGSALPVAVAYADFLAGPGVERGLIGPAETERIWDRHLLNSAVVAEIVPAQIELVDLGSGAGLPGIVLAILLPECAVRLVEPMARRTAFLSECVGELGLRNVEVVRGRAEDLTGAIKADVVVSRAVAKLRRLAELAAGLSVAGGQVLAIKGASAAEEVREAADVLRRLAAGPAEILSLGTEVLTQPTTVVRFTTAVRPHRR